MEIALWAIFLVIAVTGWTVESKLSAILTELKNNNADSTLNNIEETMDLMLKLKTGQARWNGKHFEDRYTGSDGTVEKTDD
jgi:hypothetical protein